MWDFLIETSQVWCFCTVATQFANKFSFVILRNRPNQRVQSSSSSKMSRNFLFRAKLLCKCEYINNTKETEPSTVLTQATSSSKPSCQIWVSITQKKENHQTPEIITFFGNAANLLSFIYILHLYFWWVKIGDFANGL